MTEKVLITGGAGFIGSHLADALVQQGHQVSVLDNLDAQVHQSGQRPDYLHPSAQLFQGDVRDRPALERAVGAATVIFHFAARVGVGQSMYEVQRYVDVNAGGTALLLDVLANSSHSIRKLVVASSMSIYGEGSFACDACGAVAPEQRPLEQMQAGGWEVLCPRCGRAAVPAPTRESKPLAPTSVYAVTKRDQEELCLSVGKAYKLPTVALRFFNVYGPRQALSNPYTGVAAIFLSRLMNGKPPLVFEDGLQSRDFTHVSDIVQANLLAMNSSAADYLALNVGTGRPTTVRNVAEVLAKALDRDIQPEIAQRFREGDIRHCYADISLIGKTLGYQPRVALEDGMAELVQWTNDQPATDLVEFATSQLEAKGLVR